MVRVNVYKWRDAPAFESDYLLFFDGDGVGVCFFHERFKSFELVFVNNTHQLLLVQTNSLQLDADSLNLVRQLLRPDLLRHQILAKSKNDVTAIRRDVM